MSEPTAGDRPAERPAVVALVGPSDAGKTSLVETLVGAFDDRSVATIKSIHHDIEPDAPGTDTHRHRSAGADAVVGVTPRLTFEIARGGKGADREADDEIAALRRALARLSDRGIELVLVEGFSAAALPTIHVGDDAAARAAADAHAIGTGSDPIERLRAAIEAVEPIGPASLSAR